MIIENNEVLAFVCAFVFFVCSGVGLSKTSVTTKTGSIGSSVFQARIESPVNDMCPPWN